MAATREHEPCRTVKVMSSLVSFILVIAGLYLSFQEGRIRQLESKNDSLVSMKKDVEYLTDGFKEMKLDVKLLLKQQSRMNDYGDDGNGFTPKKTEKIISGN
jgi:hypothetical protein